MLPVPDALLLDLSTTILLTRFKTLILDIGLVFSNVAMRVAFSATAAELLFAKLNAWKVFPVVAITILSDVRVSVLPFSLTNEYLSSSKGKNVSFVPAVGTVAAVIWLLRIWTSKVFLIVITESVKSKLDIFSLGNLVNKVLSEDDCNEVWRIFKSLTVIPLPVPSVGKSLATSALIPLTAVTVVTVTLLFALSIAVILPKTGSDTSPV